ncbi:MAG: FAD-dependent oxidoreductase, partial [Elusimicrobia bacterium]|nr:FAD-dependent oxidoreductase [Elusimicrobiota bacterium]
TIIAKARALGVMPEFGKAKTNGRKTAVIGGGPAGCAAAAVLAQLGYSVDVYESDGTPGGMCKLIPDSRLNKSVLEDDLLFIKSLGAVNFITGKKVPAAAQLAKKYDSVVVSTGLTQPIALGIPGENSALAWSEYLASSKKYPMKGKTVAVIGGGDVAADCAATAVRAGARHVELIYRRRVCDMPLGQKELDELLAEGVAITERARLASINAKNGKIESLSLVKLEPAKGESSDSRKLVDIPGTGHNRKFDAVIIAIGSRPDCKPSSEKGVFFAGDVANGATTVVEAAAAGKNAALLADAFMRGAKQPKIEKPVKSVCVLSGRRDLPVPVNTEFFGREIKSPFLLSAAPHSDGYDQMKLAYEAGWAGGVMKTAFDGVPIHIPGEYMFAFTQSTYANCDNVSGHPLDRVCREVEKLVREYPDRLTMASTGGPVTGNDDFDRKGWQSNTKKLERAGAMGVEYSLSCPQGGDGTKGDIVSQDPELTAKIIDWVMQVSDPDVPKLFKLTGAVTSVYPVLAAIKEVYKKYPDKKAGITLANSFPTLAFRKGAKKAWEEGVVTGMSGEGVIPISNLTLANAARHQLHISGNGGPMDYKTAANFLALGVQTVQFCTIVMKYGYGIINDLESGLSYMMEERGIGSVKELIGCALPKPITGFMELSPVKKVSSVNEELCMHCGNCTRCPYLAIKLDGRKIPVIDPAKCIGCSICVQKCFSGALSMRKRTAKELSVMEH